MSTPMHSQFICALEKAYARRPTAHMGNLILRTGLPSPAPHTGSAAAASEASHIGWPHTTFDLKVRLHRDFKGNLKGISSDLGHFVSHPDPCRPRVTSGRDRPCGGPRQCGRAPPRWGRSNNCRRRGRRSMLLWTFYFICILWTFLLQKNINLARVPALLRATKIILDIGPSNSMLVICMCDRYLFTCYLLSG